MSYALRNTIVLLVTLFLFLGAGLWYTQFYQKGTIEDLNIELTALNEDYQQKRQISDQYPALLDRYNTSRDIIMGYDKSLFMTHNPDDVYDYLSDINGVDLELFYDYVFVDSTSQGEYGIINSDIDGIGIYSDFMTFLNKIEHSELINKIVNVSVNPSSYVDGVQYINFTIKLQSFYQRAAFEANNSGLDPIRMDAQLSVSNPFDPLILAQVPPNDEGLVNVEASRLLGMTGTRIFVIDGSGQRHMLKVGDRVYLGYLQSINTEEREVTFNLDKGGIQEIYTMKVER